MEDPKSLSPVIRVAITAALSDTLIEFEALRKAASCSTTLPQTSTNYNEKSEVPNSDTLLKELNKVFFETLIHFEKCRREDYIELDDGNFRKLNETESTLSTFLEEVSKIMENLRVLRNEIEDKGTFKIFVRQCELKQAAVDVLVDLAKTSLEREEIINNIQTKIDNAVLEFAEQKERYNATLQRIRNEWQESKQLAKMTIHSLDRKYKQDLGIYSHVCDAKNKHLTDYNAFLHRQLLQESRQTTETMSYLYGELDTNVTRLEYLHGKTDVEDKKAQLAKLETDLEQKISEHIALKKDFAICEAVVFDYRNEVEKKRLQAEYMRKYIVCVLEVQAWWRTVIVKKNIKLRKIRKGKNGKKAEGKKGKKGKEPADEK